MIAKLLGSPALHVAIVGLVNSVIQLLSSFDVHLSSNQNAAITGVVNALLLVLSLGLQQIGNAAAAKSG